MASVWLNMLIKKSLRWWLLNRLEVQLRPRKCEIFAKLLTIVAKLSILDTCWGPDYASAVD